MQFSHRLTVLALIIVFFTAIRGKVKLSAPPPYNRSTASMETQDTLKPFKILALGDSLTEGFYNGGRKFHSYTLEMQNVLNAALSIRHRRVVMQQVGMSGEYTSHMIPRLLRHLEGARPPYQLVCLLGGTNDISLADSPHEIAARLTDMYDAVLESHAMTTLVAITIPQSYFLDTNYVEKRSFINTKIKEYCLRHSDRVLLVDLEHLLPYFKGDGSVDTVHWDDHLHMTPKGYDLFGQFVADSVLSSMKFNWE